MPPRFTTLALKLQAAVSGKEDFVSRVWMLVMAVVAGAAVALGATFTVTSVLSSSNESPVNQQLYNYGTN